MARSAESLKMVTIGPGFDLEFDGLHLKLLRRIHVGPMYSHAFTIQTSPSREILLGADTSDLFKEAEKLM